MQTVAISTPMRRHDVEAWGFALWMAGLWAAFDFALALSLPAMFARQGFFSSALPKAAAASHLAADFAEHHWQLFIAAQVAAVAFIAYAFGKVEDGDVRRHFGWMFKFALCGLTAAVLIAGLPRF